MMYLFVTNTQLFSVHDVNRWTGVVWITCDVFISCLDSHSDGTHSLQRIHLIASNAKLLLICYDWSKNSSTSCKLSFLGELPYSFKCRFESSQDIFIGVTHYLKSTLYKGQYKITFVKREMCRKRMMYSTNIIFLFKTWKKSLTLQCAKLYWTKKKKKLCFVYNKFENSLQHALKSKKHPMLI